MKDTRLPALPALSARYLRYVMAFGVTLAVGLAPLLGGRQIRLPGFVAFLDFFPISMQRWLVPFAAFVMAMPAIAVQFYATEIVAKRHLRGVFRIGLGVMAGMLLLLCSLYTLFTLQVSIPGTSRLATYVIAAAPRTDCACGKISIEQCVGDKVSLNPVEVEGCFPSEAVRLRKLLLAVTYLFFMSGFGTVIGSLILREEVERRRPPKERLPRIEEM